MKLPFHRHRHKSTDPKAPAEAAPHARASDLAGEILEVFPDGRQPNSPGRPAPSGAKPALKQPMNFRQTPEDVPDRRGSVRTSLEDRLVRHPSGRAVLHVLVWCRTRRNFAWHWAGIRRQLRLACRRGRARGTGSE